jgi:ATP-dependent exoDNAse (exonuclease V) beta subunit
MSEPHALLVDERARHEALDVRRSLLLQAPAGSGKTTVLTARFLALLAAADAPEEILAITFTRKAAAEMRHRILAALEAADEGKPIPGIDAELLQRASARDRERGWQLRRNAARLRIETIDALSYRLASALPIAARGGSTLHITPTPAPLYRRAARSALRAALEQSEGAAAVRLLLDRLDNRWLRLERLLAEMLARRSHWLPRVLQAESAGLSQRVSESLDAVLRAQLAGVAACFAAPALREAEALLAPSAAAAPVLGAEPASLPHWRALSELTLRADGQWRQRLSVREGLGRQDTQLKQRVRDWIDARSAEPPTRAALLLVRSLPDAHLSGEEQTALAALTLLLTAAAAELQLQFAEQGRVDYAYVAAAARQALSEQGEPSELALRASAELRHILLDEFQDTSFEQFELLQALTAGWEPGEGRTLFIVGDPMQSIYQFREAEVGLFLRVRDHGLGAIGFETLQLRRNFRSDAGLIDWLNSHFAQLFPQQDDARLAAVRYLSSTAAPGAAPSSTAPVQLHRVGAGDRAAEAARVLQIVAAERQCASDRSIAVLVAAREHAALIVARLRTAGYALRGVDLEPLRDRPAVRDLSALARALLHGADRTAWLSIVRAPWCGLTLDALEPLAAQAGADLFASLRGWVPALADDAARLARLCAALEPAVLGAERGLPLWQRVERCWLRLGGPAIYPDAIDRLDAHRFMDALATHEEPDALVGDGMAALTEPLYSVAPAQPGAIEVMTMHAAKGLEWDVVIVPGLDSRGAPDTDPLLHWIELPRPGQGTDLLLAPIRSADDAPEGRLATYIKQLRRSRQRLERVRQLYVAATRARHSLHLLAALECAPQSGKPPAPAFGSLLAVLWPVIAAEFCAPETACNPTATSATLIGSASLKRVPANWQLPPLPALPRPQRLRLSAEVEAGTPEYSWVGLTARAVGTVVHGELRRLAALDLLPPATELQQRRAHHLGWLAELGVAADEQGAAQALVSEALERTLGDARGRWLLSRQHPVAESEWRLTGVHEGRIVNVIFDRMLIDQQRQRWIVDYKTSRHEGGGLTQFIDREAERYAPQMRRYAALAAALGGETVRVALYFPLLGVFRELPL